MYSVNPDGTGPTEVYCDQETFGGGWTILERRVEGSVDFNRSWNDYVNGFGDLERNFWLGNDLIHRLTKIKQEALFDVESESGDNSFTLYKSFQVEGKSSQYKINIDEYQNSVMGDSMSYHNGMYFSTRDQDNDSGSENCADRKAGGWWHKACARAFLNGQYGNNNDSKIKWPSWAGNDYLSKAEMKVRGRHGKQPSPAKSLPEISEI